MSIELRKVAIIGTGHVGSHVAFSLATQGEVDQLYMVDIDKDKAIAQATDINDAVSYLPHRVEAIASAGPLPSPEQDRLDTLGSTIEVLREFLPRVKASGFNGFIVSISNPADVVAAYVQEYLDYPKHKIISSGTSLDSARLQRLVAEQIHVHRRSLSCYAMGEHGGSAMVPWSHVTVSGKPLKELQQELPHRFPTFDEDAVVEQMKYGGYLVLIGKGSTEFGIAASVTEIIRAYFHDEQKVLPLSCKLEGIGKNGIEEILTLHLTPSEQEAFHNSCERIREYIKLAHTL